MKSSNAILNELGKYSEYNKRNKLLGKEDFAIYFPWLREKGCIIVMKSKRKKHLTKRFEH